MPLHEYECKKCGHRFERIQKFSDPPVKKCPECGGKVEQLLSAPAVQFKGSGWYVTDYARKSSGSSASGSDSGSKSDSSSDSTESKDRESKDRDRESKDRDRKESKDTKDSKDKKSKPEPAAKKSEKK
jgi:putative FmdB family regulatory protein